MLSEDKTNGEARCFLCMKDKLDDYNFQEEDFLSLILGKKTINEKNKPKETQANTLNLIKIGSQALIKPCKCGTFAHIPCLIQYSLLHLGYRCEECQCDYNFTFKTIDPNESGVSFCSLYTQIVLTIIFHIGLLAVTIVFFSVEIIPDKFKFWNYLLGIIILLFNGSLILGNVSIFKEKYKHTQRIYPMFEPYVEGKKRTEEEYEKMQLFFEQILKSNIYELMEKKINSRFFISSTLNPQRNLNDYIIANNNEIFDSNSERVKEELKNEDLEDKFHGHQIIKSTLVMNEQTHNNLFGRKGSKSNYFEALEGGTKVNFYKSQTRNQNMKKESKIPKGNGVNSMVKIQFNTNTNNKKEKEKEKGGEGNDLNSKSNLINDSVTIKVDKKNSNENITNQKEGEKEDENKPTIEQLMMKNMKKIKKKVEEIKNSNDIPSPNINNTNSQKNNN